MSSWALRIPVAAILAAFSFVATSYAASPPTTKPQPHGIISGRVRAKDRTPLAGVTVAALRLEYFGEQKRYSVVESAKTRADGTYSLPGLSPAKYYMVALAPDPLPADDERAAALPRAPQLTYYPSSNSPDDAIPVAVTAGTETAAIELTISDTPTHSLCGNVQGLPDILPEPLNLALFRLGPQSLVFPPRKTAITNPSAGSATHFCFHNLPAGDYSLELQGSLPISEGTVAAAGTTEVSLSTHDLAGLQVHAGFAPHVEGSIHAEQTVNRQDVYINMTLPVPVYDDNQALIALEPNPNAVLLPVRSQPFDPTRATIIPGFQEQIDMRILLDPVDSFQKGLPPLKAQVQEEGHFTLESVPPGRYRLSTEDVPIGFFIKRVRYGGRDLTSDDLEISSGSSGQLDVLLSADASFIRGTVLDGNGTAAGGALVSLLPVSDSQLFSEGQIARTTTARQDGRFAFWNLPPGTYSVWAWQQLDSPGLATRPSFLRSFAERAVRIEAINSADPSYVVRVNFVPREEVSRNGWQ